MKVAQRITIKLLVFLVLSGLFFLACPLLAADIDYPTRPINITQGMAPGAANFISLNIIAKAWDKYSGSKQPLVIESRTGAAGMVGLDYVNKQPADGYNLYWFFPNITIALAKAPRKYHFKLTDYTFFGYFCYSPMVLTVAKASPFKTIEDFVEYAKKNPGALTVGTSGIGGGPHLTLELFSKAAGIKITHVPFPSGTATMAPMLGGHISANINSFGTVRSCLMDGTGRALVGFGPERYPPFPDVPSAIEKGYDVERSLSLALGGKKEIPKPIQDYLVKVWKQMGTDPTVQSELSKAGFVPKYMGPEETEKFYMEDFKLCSALLNEMGLVEK
jgi:tripartite-type tricarboxylate transporter receptor subunit TctC